MVIKIILNRDETSLFAGLAVFKFVIDVNCFPRLQLQFLDRVFKDCWIRFHEPHFVGIDASLKKVENRVVGLKERDVDSVGIRQ